MMGKKRTFRVKTFVRQGKGRTAFKPYLSQSKTAAHNKLVEIKSRSNIPTTTHYRVVKLKNGYTIYGKR